VIKTRSKEDGRLKVNTVSYAVVDSMTRGFIV